MPSTTNVPTLTLNTGATTPQLGFGVFQIPPEDTAETVRTALDAGYRSVDTAAMYGNEAEVGEAIRDSGLDRDEVFVTTKLDNGSHGRDAALRAFEQSLEQLGLDRVDLYLIHWPLPDQNRYVETWKALEEVHADGRARAIGVSNFQIPHLYALLEESDTVPAVNQIELHPGFAQPDLREFHSQQGILTEAWSPLAQGGDSLDGTRSFGDEGIAAIADAHGRTPAQIILRWHLQLGNVVIPKSVTPERIEENIAVTGFELTKGEMEQIGRLDSEDGRIGPDPDSFTG
jgi:2,5-diketo-D-gluconate reductase A